MRKIDKHRLMYQYRQLPPNMVIIEAQNETGPKEREFPLRPEQENWPLDAENPLQNFVVPEVPVLSEGAPKIAELVKNLPGSVTVRHIHSQPPAEQKLVHVSLDGTVTGVTLGEGSTLHPCSPEDHRWFRLEAVNNNTVSNSEIIISADENMQVTHSQNTEPGMTVFEIDNSALRSAELPSPKPHLNSTANMEISFVNDARSTDTFRLLTANTESVECVRKNRGILTVSKARNCIEYDSNGRRIIRSTKTWVIDYTFSR